ncbi:MAG TPA: transposase family protein [Candidatus Dormibacteraeota bacterium]|nr:transposase family protein [Candidatus Dormibacteraeota bacterium]
MKPKIGLRTTRPNEMWRIDTTVIRLLDGTRAYLHAVIDNFSRRILAWRVAETFAPVNSVAVLLDAGRVATLSFAKIPPGLNSFAISAIPKPGN